MTYGLELEKTTSNITTHRPHKVTQDFFRRLAENAKHRGAKHSFHTSDLQPEAILGVYSSDLRDQGLDNAFNLLESGLPNVPSLTRLNKLITEDLRSSQAALNGEGATFLNSSIHPLGNRDAKTYRAMVAPKGVYQYIWFRGWDHSAGIDARSQNSPSTDVEINQAAEAVSAIIGCGAAFIGLFGNSPFEEGQRSEYKESRLKMWDRMMRRSKVSGDLATTQFPPAPFQSLGDYFNWMFGAGTSIHFVIDETTPSGDYKGVGSRMLIIENSPSVLEYLAKPQWQASYLHQLQNNLPSIDMVRVKPDISHLENMQFAQFAGARFRYGLENHNEFPLVDFLEACSNPQPGSVEKIISPYLKFGYIEGRDPGANYPDLQILAAGKDIAKSVTISPSAIQAGLIQNLEQTTKLINKYSWTQLGALREAAIKDGLAGHAGDLSVLDFAKQVVEVAGQGLKPEEAWMLDYPLWVLKTGKNGADRAIETVDQGTGTLTESIEKLVGERQVVII